ncbi:MAG: hypothetical protein JKY66_08415 [Spongiibacteraceae bacterium]|nr:hypothetical protein [Spongiibacteraceae bacterium]
MNNTSSRGYRGYIGSRAYRGQTTPQHVQNLVIRDYCQRNQLLYLLSATEYHMPGAYIMLEEVLGEIEQLDGMVFYSFSLLPSNQSRREGVIKRVLESGGSLHCALENLCVHDQRSWQQLEDILAVTRLVKEQSELSPDSFLSQ